VADYASISLVNARLFEELEARAERLQEKINQVESLEHADAQLTAETYSVLGEIHSRLLAFQNGMEPAEKKQELQELIARLEQLVNPDAAS